MATSVKLSRERVLHAAVDLIDARGIDALTMRKLAEALGVEAMSLYHHVANKEAVLDGVVEVVIGEIADAVDRLQAPADGDWKATLRARILAARSVMLRHPWAPGVLETRKTTSLAVIRYFNGVVGVLRHGGFGYDLIHHALHTLGSRALGFAQELFDEGGGDSGPQDIPPQLAEEVPYLVEMLAEVAHDDPESTLGWCDDQVEFEFGLDLILDGLERLRLKR